MCLLRRHIFLNHLLVEKSEIVLRAIFVNITGDQSKVSKMRNMDKDVNEIL